MNKIVFALTLVALVSAGADLEASLKDLHVGQQCANSVNAYTVTSFTVVPFPPTRGSSPVTTSVGTFNSAQTIKAIHANVLLNGRSIYQENVPESGSYTAGQVGTFKYSQAVPSIAPKGSYTLNGGLVNSGNVQINCWEVAFTLN